MGTGKTRRKRVRRDEGQKEDDVTKDSSEHFAKGVIRAYRKGVLEEREDGVSSIDSCLQGGHSRMANINILAAHSLKPRICAETAPIDVFLRSHSMNGVHFFKVLPCLAARAPSARTVSLLQLCSCKLRSYLGLPPCLPTACTFVAIHRQPTSFDPQLPRFNVDGDQFR